jgi:hypothetical protein
LPSSLLNSPIKILLFFQCRKSEGELFCISLPFVLMFTLFPSFLGHLLLLVTNGSRKDLGVGGKERLLLRSVDRKY